MPRGGWLDDQQRSHRLWHLTAYLAGTVALYLVLRRLAPILSPLVAALGLAYLLDPLVERLARRGVPRAAAVAMILLGFAIVLLGAIAILLPLVAHDVQRFLPRLPILAERAVAWIERTFHVDMPDTWRDAVEQGGAELKRLAGAAALPLVRSLALALGGVLSFLTGLLSLALVPVFAFYLLLDWPRLVAYARDLVPARRRATFVEVAREIDGVVSTWLRGQLTVMVIEAIVYAVGLSLVGVQLAVPIGILAGLLSVIPYVGFSVGIVLAMLMAVLDWHGVPRLVWVGVVFGLVQVLENLVLVPVFVGKKVGLSEAGALFAVIAGAELLGFTGMLLAIPLAAAAAVIIRRVLRCYKETGFYQEAEAAPDEAPAGGPGP